LQWKRGVKEKKRNEKKVEGLKTKDGRKSLSERKKGKNFMLQHLSKHRREEKRITHTAKDGWIIEIRDK